MNNLAITFTWTQESMTDFIKTNIKPDVTGLIDWKRFTKQWYKKNTNLYPLLEKLYSSSFMNNPIIKRKVFRFISNLWYDVTNLHYCKCNMRNWPIFYLHGEPIENKYITYIKRLISINLDIEIKKILLDILNEFVKIFADTEHIKTDNNHTNEKHSKLKEKVKSELLVSCANQ